MNSATRQTPLFRADSRYIKLSPSSCPLSVSGSFLADQWHLSPDLNEVARRHHDPENSSLYRPLVALVNIADLVCRTCGLGYGYNESTKPALLESPAGPILASECTAIRTLGVTRFASEMDMYADEVRRLVGVLFRLER